MHMTQVYSYATIDIFNIITKNYIKLILILNTNIKTKFLKIKKNIPALSKDGSESSKIVKGSPGYIQVTAKGEIYNSKELHPHAMEI